MGCSAAGDLSLITPAIRGPSSVLRERRSGVIFNVHGTVKTIELLHFENEKPKLSIGSLKLWFRYGSIFLKTAVSVLIS